MSYNTAYPAKKLIKLTKNALAKKSEADLNEAQQNLLRLCRLIVDIEYKRKFGKNLDKETSNVYSGVTDV